MDSSRHFVEIDVDGRGYYRCLHFVRISLSAWYCVCTSEVQESTSFINYHSVLDQSSYPNLCVDSSTSLEGIFELRFVIATLQDGLCINYSGVGQRFRGF